MNKKEYYEYLKKKISEDGKKHQSIITKEGIIIDGKLYSQDKKPINSENINKRK